MLGPYQFQPVFPLLQKYLQKLRALSLQPFSSKNQPFTEWQLQPYDFIRNGFCYDKAFEANVWGKTNRSVFKIKQTVYQEKGRFQLSNDVKFWFDLPRAGSLYLRFWTNNSFKLSYDHGLYAYKGQCYYLFGGTKGNKNLQNCDFRVGLGLVSQNFISENRLKYQRIKEKQENKYQWLHKTYIGHKRLRFGLMSVVDLSRSVLQKNNVLLGFYFKTGSCAFLRAQVNGFRHQNPQIGRPQTYFDHITADYIHDLSDKSKCAIEVKYSIKQNKIQEAVAVYEFEYEPKRRIKASFSNRMNLGILTKLPLFGLEQYADLSASLLFKDITGKNTTIQSGFQLNVNL